MSRHIATLGLEADPAEIESACVAALIDLGWQAMAAGGEVLGKEDPTRLACHDSPATARLRINSPGADLTAEVSIRIDVPGFGPISSRHAGECSRALARAIHARTRQR